MKLFWLGTLFILTLLAPQGVQTDPELEDEDVVAVIKCGYIYKFATSTDWPADRKTGPFKVGVYGSQGVYEQFVGKYATKPVGSQAIECVAFENVDDIDFCHILYVSKSKLGDLNKIKQKLGNQPTLVVANDESALNAGAAISFVTLDNATKYVINAKAAEDRGLTFGSTIILWAVNN